MAKDNLKFTKTNRPTPDNFIEFACEDPNAAHNLFVKNNHPLAANSKLQVTKDTSNDPSGQGGPPTVEPPEPPTP